MPPIRCPRRPGPPPAAVAYAILAVAVAALVSACGSAPRSTPAAGSATIRIASYDFSENQALAALYAGQLRRHGFRTTVVTGLGTREIVEPALEQGRIDFLVDYTGTLLDFVSRGKGNTHADPAAVSRALRDLLASRGLTLLAYAPGQDQNGFAVTPKLAATGVRKLSDLEPLAHRLVLGAPPECPTRTYCLLGLQRVYGLHFRAFTPMPTRQATATALESGEIDVGLFDTTDVRLVGGGPVLLADDRALQPRENIVPLVRSAILRSRGPQLTQAVDALSRRLTTERLRALNRMVEVDHRTPDQAASMFLASLPK